MSSFPGEKLAERYDREAGAYRELWAPVLRPAGLRLVHELQGTHPKRVLDVGTGVGSLLPDLRIAFPEAFILGVDRSRGMLSLAPKESSRAVMDAAKLGVAGTSIDLVLMAFVIFHLEAPEDGLRETRRVLRPEGQIGLVTWATELRSKATAIWTECLDAHGAVAPDPQVQARHDRCDTPEKMELLLERAGFSPVRSWTEELVECLDGDRLIRLRTAVGSVKPRYDSLSPEARAACVAAARRRYDELHRDDFVARADIVYTIGQKPRGALVRPPSPGER